MAPKEIKHFGHRKCLSTPPFPKHSTTKSTIHFEPTSQSLNDGPLRFQINSSAEVPAGEDKSKRHHGTLLGYRVRMGG